MPPHILEPFRILTNFTKHILGVKLPYLMRGLSRPISDGCYGGGWQPRLRAVQLRFNSGLASQPISVHSEISPSSGALEKKGRINITKSINRAQHSLLKSRKNKLRLPETTKLVLGRGLRGSYAHGPNSRPIVLTAHWNFHIRSEHQSWRTI